MVVSRARAWQRMLSGRRLDLLDPSPLDVELVDIAHGLARVARWNGQTIGDYPFSVAQHSVLVLELFRAVNPTADARALLYAVLHDAPEYVMGDIISPFKAAMGGNYKDVENRLLGAVHRPEAGLGDRLVEHVAAQPSTTDGAVEPGVAVEHHRGELVELW